MIFIGIGISAAISLIIYYLIIKPKLRIVNNTNAEIQTANQQLLTEQLDLQTQKDNLITNIRTLQQTCSTQKQECDILLTKREEIKNSITDLESQAKTSANIFLQNNIDLAQTNLDKAIEKMSAATASWQQEAEAEYLNTLADCVKSFDDRIQDKQIELQKLTEKYNNLQSIVNTAVAANKRAEEMKTQAAFYQLQLADEDIHEIAELRKVAHLLRDAEPLNKVIWKVYYEKPYTDLIGRVVGTNKITGIYKITHLSSGRCYVGQSIDIAERWKQHIKRGLGAETPTRNKLYPAMLQYGPEAFSFEIVEECNRQLLDAREDYWQDYFKAVEFGFSIK